MIPGAMLADLTRLLVNPLSTQLQGQLETEEHLRWLDAPPAWILGLVLIPAIVGICWWTYRREAGLSLAKRWTLAGLRGLALLGILIASFRPAIETTRNLKERTEVHILVDDSASMGRHESYSAELADLLREAMGSKAPKDFASVSRAELVSLFLGGGGSNAAAMAAAPGRKLLLGLAKDFDVRFFRFWDRSEAINDLSELRSKGPSTRIGDSLDLHLVQHAGQGGGAGRLDSIILISDGRSNEGLSPLESARRLRAAQIPLHCIAVGDPDKERNLILSGPAGPKDVLQDEEAVFELHITASGLESQDARVTLTGFRKSDEGDDAPLHLPSNPVEYASTGFVVPRKGVTRSVKIIHHFDEPGDYILTFKVAPMPGETNPKDNVTRRYLRVDPDKIRVLYLEDQPRWEYRYMKNALKRVDKSIQLQAFLFDASRNFPQEKSEGLESLVDLPRTKAELFKYHVILIGDVPPKKLGSSEEERRRWLELVKDFVEHGGGLGLIAGENAMPGAYRDTAIEELLPVVIDPYGDGDLPVSIGKEFHPTLEDPHNPHPIVRLLDDIESNKRLWEVGLPGMYWYYPVLRAKAGGTVLLRHEFDENKYGRRVLLAIAPYPKGLVAFSAFDSTWRWRKPYGEKYMDPYWRKLVRTLAENRLRRMDDRVILNVDRNEVDIGTRIRVRVQLFDQDFNPVTEEDCKIHLRDPSGKLKSIHLPRQQGQAGQYEALVSLTAAGVYSFLVYRDAEPGSRPLAREDVIVRVPERELSNATLDEQALISLADAGGGKFARLQDMDVLLEAFRDRGGGQKVVDRRTRQIWDQAWTVLLLILILAMEWALRKKWNLL